MPARGPGRRIDVSLRRQVALLIERGRTVRVIHVSTGKPSSPTPPGRFTVFRKELRSWSVPFQVWLPYASYPNQGIAFHESPDVPAYPASAGCVRIPASDSALVYRFATLGTKVIVRRSGPSARPRDRRGGRPATTASCRAAPWFKRPSRRPNISAMACERLKTLVRGLLVGCGVVGTHIGVEQQAVALEERWRANASGVLDLLRSGTTNLVTAGDVNGLHDVLRDVRRYRGVADAYVLDARGRVLSGSPTHEERLRAMKLARNIGDEDAEPHVVLERGYLDTLMPLVADGERDGVLFVRYDVREVRAEARLARQGGFLLGIGVTTVAVIAVTLVAGRLTRALVRLTEAARVAAEEDLPRVLAAVRDGRPVDKELLPERFEVSDGAEVQRLAGALICRRAGEHAAHRSPAP